MWEGEGPKLGGRPEKVDEALPSARAHLGSVGDADEVRLSIVAVLAVEVLAGRDDEGLDAVPGLRGG